MPSIELLIPHFLKELTTVSVGMDYQALWIHWVIRVKIGLFRLPPSVCSLSALIIHSHQNSRILVLHGLLRHTSRGCSRDVHQPGITSGVICLPSLCACISRVDDPGTSPRLAGCFSEGMRLVVSAILFLTMCRIVLQSSNLFHSRRPKCLGQTFLLTWFFV